MKKNYKVFLFALTLLILVFPLFPEKAKLRTGDAFGFSVTDYFFPPDITVTGSKCSITSIKKIDKDLWCLSLSTFRSAQMPIPVIYDYYIKSGDTISMRRLSNPMEEIPVKIEDVTWNEVVISVW